MCPVICVRGLCDWNQIDLEVNYPEPNQTRLMFGIWTQKEKCQSPLVKTKDQAASDSQLIAVNILNLIYTFSKSDLPVWDFLVSTAKLDPSSAAKVSTTYILFFVL